MNFELQGSDRDKLIALKKGIVSDGKGHYYNQIDKEKSRFTITRIPDWSTNRNDAWELFIELPLEYREQLISKWRKVGFAGDKFASLTSREWLIWKYGKI